MDKLAKEGVLFKNVFSHCNHTVPCLLSAFTGRDPLDHGIYGFDRFGHWETIWDGWEGPFHSLRKNGYIVAGDDAQIYAPLEYRDNGRDVIKSLNELHKECFFLWRRPEITHTPYNPKAPYDTMFLPEDYTPNQTTLAKMEIVRSKLIIHRPGFVSRLETGTPDTIEKEGYTRTAGEVELTEDDKPWVHALYDGEVKTLDDEIGEYLKCMEDLNLLDNTMVVITADHGEALLERGALGHSSVSLEGTLYDENIKIPLIIWCPSLISAGRIVETQVSQIDIMPTIFDLLGLTMPKETNGRSLVPLVDGTSKKYQPEAYAVTEPCGWQKLDDDKRIMWCIRTPPWKLIKYFDPGKQNIISHELFNLAEDPGERNNVLDKCPEIAKLLKGKLDNWIKEKQRKNEVGEPSLDKFIA